MGSLRKSALHEISTRKPVPVTTPSDKVSDYYGTNVFNKNTMNKYLSKESYEKVMEAIENSTRIDRKIADQVAHSMKTWALEKGATHFTHWFQPLTGLTAEKHDAFFEPTGNGDAIEKFSGSELAQQEPDASSFPSGGIRNTFEARGYTAWDPASPAFILGKTLCIPTIYISYTGETLDVKTPLLKALTSIDKAATEVCQYFDKNVTKVSATLGWEQEYFLVDSALFNARPDLELTGRTLFGHAPARGQQLEDHYFGSISERVLAFIRELETECLILGIPVRTRHNEVAPNQFECAPIFEEANLAVDHNLLLMDVMEKVARRHNFRVLLHEKPFANVNGSGKHNNWSMQTDTGVNLLRPGKTPKTNLQFLTFFVNTIKAVHEYADILRASIASVANDHRLGANEAPPAIISIFIGEQLTKILTELEEKVHSGKLTPEEKTNIKLNIGRIPEILLDNTDRNRTSPFAFTGNKFEFRAVGSSANCGWPMTVLNLIVADQLRKFKKEVDAQIEKGSDKDVAILQVLRDYIITSKKVLFEGNGYSEEWEKEAAKRGLPNVKTTPEALDALVTKKNVALFTTHEVFSEREAHSRHEIALENYLKKLQIEARVAGELVYTHIIPAALKYQNLLIENVKGLTSIGLGVMEMATEPVLETTGATKTAKTAFKSITKETADTNFSSTQLELVKSISYHVNTIKTGVDKMVNERKLANAHADTRDKAFAYCNNVKPYLEEIRYHVDKLEMLVEDELWPLPKYREMLFTR